MTTFSVHCNCTNEESIEIDEDILENISDYTDTMENYFFRKKFHEDILFRHFDQYSLPPLPIDPFSINYLVFGIDPEYYYSPFVLSKLCEVLDVKIGPGRFFGEEYVTILDENIDTSNPDQQGKKFHLKKEKDGTINYDSFEAKLNNYYEVKDESAGSSKVFVSIHNVTTDGDSKSLIINKGPEYLSHETAQILQELNLIFFTYEFKLIQQLRGEEKSRIELENLQKKYIFTDWGQIYPYVFPQENFSILEDQKNLRKRKFPF
ncbi:MAG: hypothetical protein ACW981_16160 [Candidatus Hodarchaeales archaeon]